MNQSKVNFLSSASLYVLVDSVDFLDDPNSPRLLALIRSLLLAGVHLVQLRDKRLNDRQLIEVGRRIKGLTRKSGSRFIMNDRVDLAMLTDADGVHLGQEDLTLKDAQKLMGSEKIIGISTHSLMQARHAHAEGADYIGIGPVFPSKTKSFEQFAGLDLLQAVAKEGTCPAFAIGGIDHSNVEQVLEAGLRRIAVGSAICQTEDPQSAAEELLKKLRTG